MAGAGIAAGPRQNREDPRAEIGDRRLGTVQPRGLRSAKSNDRYEPAKETLAPFRILPLHPTCPIAAHGVGAFAGAVPLVGDRRSSIARASLREYSVP